MQTGSSAVVQYCAAQSCSLPPDPPPALSRAMVDLFGCVVVNTLHGTLLHAHRRVCVGSWQCFKSVRQSMSCHTSMKTVNGEVERVCERRWVHRDGGQSTSAKTSLSLWLEK